MFYSTSATRTIIGLSALLLTACATSRRESSAADTSTSITSLTSARTESLRLDSLLCSFSFSADSITLLIPTQTAYTVEERRPVAVTMHRVSTSHSKAASSRTLLTSSTDSTARTTAVSREQSSSQSSARPVSIAAVVISLIPGCVGLLLLIALFRRLMKKIE